MQASKVIAATLTAAALLAASVSAAEARWYGHRGPGPVAGLLGGVVVGAATIATLPFALLADAARGGRRNNYGPDDYGYGPPPSYYGQGRDDYNYGPPRGGYGYGPPPPPPRYYRPYGPPPGYYGY